MAMGSILGPRLGTILNYKRDPYVDVKGPVLRLKLTVAYIAPSRKILKRCWDPQYDLRFNVLLRSI